MRHLGNSDMPVLHNRVQDIVAGVFENYYMLSEVAESGLAEGLMQQRNYHAAALDPAIALLGSLIEHPQKSSAFCRTLCQNHAQKSISGPPVQTCSCILINMHSGTPLLLCFKQANWKIMVLSVIPIGSEIDLGLQQGRNWNALRLHAMKVVNPNW